MTGDRPKLAQAWRYLKERPYLLPLVIVAAFLTSMWALNHERPFELTQVAPEVLAAIPADLCGPQPKFKTLKSRITREIREDGIPVEITIDRVETLVRPPIVLRREEWFYKNSLSPIRQVRSYIACGFVGLHYDERAGFPFFGDLLKEVGWQREKIAEMQVRERTGFPNSKGGVFEYTKISTWDLNVDTGLRKAVVRPVRCVVAARINAYTVHPKLSGDGYQVNCTSELDVKTTGGIPSKDKSEKVKRVSVYYFIEQLGWLVLVREAEDADFRSDSTLVEFSVE